MNEPVTVAEDECTCACTCVALFSDADCYCQPCEACAARPRSDAGAGGFAAWTGPCCEGCGLPALLGCDCEGASEHG